MLLVGTKMMVQDMYIGWCEGTVHLRDYICEVSLDHVIVCQITFCTDQVTSETFDCLASTSIAILNSAFPRRRTDYYDNNGAWFMDMDPLYHCLGPQLTVQYVLKSDGFI